MDEYVSRAGIIAEYDRQHQGPPGGARKIMETFPAADVRPAVRGKWEQTKDEFGIYNKCSATTNADRFRSMTDEELATYLNNMQGVAYVNGSDNVPIRPYPNNYGAWLDWLRQEAVQDARDDP